MNHDSIFLECSIEAIIEHQLLQIKIQGSHMFLKTWKITNSFTGHGNILCETDPLGRKNPVNK